MENNRRLYECSQERISNLHAEIRAKDRRIAELEGELAAKDAIIRRQVIMMAERQSNE
jgi:hypothetical protein|uniref:Docking domain containing protein n=1 Tax=Myoviridae sp. ctxpQ22 TaxID=2826715 RepID=A0A8S5N4B8_9CAUD|nr:MAG TPA: docking domain containing protein [Myoviridae sp. ctxpQ22]